MYRVISPKLNSIRSRWASRQDKNTASSIRPRTQDHYSLRPGALLLSPIKAPSHASAVESLLLEHPQRPDLRPSLMTCDDQPRIYLHISGPFPAGGQVAVNVPCRPSFDRTPLIHHHMATLSGKSLIWVLISWTTCGQNIWPGAFRGSRLAKPFHLKPLPLTS
ncbi:hypothetical protein LY76DRAFT_59555 [Colletotrichum caudatum]|nr:hypothetical protein LY76DRAFT_59555 [Colletotrichum caudatum]